MSTPHYLIATAGRPFLQLKATPREYTTARMQAFVSPLNIVAVGFLPFLNEFNRRMEIRVAKEKDKVKPDPDATQKDLVAASRTAALSFSLSVLRETCYTMTMRWLIAKDNKPLFQSTAYVADSYFSLQAHYIGRVLDKFYLPARWSTLLAVPPSKEQLAYHEQKGLSVSATMEDSVKRQAALTFIRSLADTIAVTVCWGWKKANGVKPKKDDKPAPPVWVLVAAIWLRGAASCAVGTVGAALGRTAGPGWELFFEAVFQRVGERLVVKAVPWAGTPLPF